MFGENLVHGTVLGEDGGGERVEKGRGGRGGGRKGGKEEFWDSDFSDHEGMKVKSFSGSAPGEQM